MLPDLPLSPLSLFSLDNTHICNVRQRDTDEQAIRAAICRGLSLPHYVVVRRVNKDPRVYEVLNEGKIITLNGEETERRKS